MIDKNSIVIGVTGHPGSGKDAVADYIVSLGASKLSGGDILREEMIKLGLTVNRTTINMYVSKMRKKYGNGYLSYETLRRIKGDTTISGIRNTEEVRIFRERLGDKFKLIALETPLEVRYLRAKYRGRIGDDVTFEKFQEEEARERATDSGAHEVDRVIMMSDIIIDNTGTLMELFEKIDGFLSEIKE